MLKRFLCLTLVFFLSSHLWAENIEKENVSSVDVIEFNQYKKVGSAKFSVYFWDIYNSTLYTTTGQYPVSVEQSNIVFHIEYLRDITSADLIERTIEQWQHLGLKSSEYQQYLPQLEQLWPDIKAGDSLTLLINQSQSKFYFNQKYLGSIKQHIFGQQFLNIWLSAKSSQPKLRAQLLGVTNT